MNTATQQVWRVSANLDQVSRFAALKHLKWEVTNPLVPNRVHFNTTNMADARHMYAMLKRNKLVALRNWLD